MRWLIQKIVEHLRADAPLAEWVGKDKQGRVKIYHGRAPRLADLQDHRYMVFYTDLGGGAPVEVCGDGQVVDQALVEFLLVDKSDGSGLGVAEGYDLLRAAMEPGWKVADGSNALIGVERQGPLRGPTVDDNDEWSGSVDYRMYVVTK
jgi:hypothetical protein